MKMLFVFVDLARFWKNNSFFSYEKQYRSRCFLSFASLSGLRGKDTFLSTSWLIRKVNSSFFYRLAHHYESSKWISSSSSVLILFGRKTSKVCVCVCVCVCVSSFQYRTVDLRWCIVSTSFFFPPSPKLCTGASRNHVQSNWERASAKVKRFCGIISTPFSGWVVSISNDC